VKHKIDDIPRFDDPALEREWQAQENAMRREHLHLDPTGEDPRSQRYRLLARALRATPPDSLPGDFAQRVSALAAASEPARTTAMTLEMILAATLASLLLLTAVTATFIYGATWWPAFAALQPTPATTQWLLALVGCLGLSWLAGAGSRLSTEPHDLR
jgi:hypothetical protein